MYFKGISDLSDGARIRLFPSVPDAQKTIFSQATLNGPLPLLSLIKTSKAIFEKLKYSLLGCVCVCVCISITNTILSVVFLYCVKLRMWRLTCSWFASVGTGVVPVLVLSRLWLTVCLEGGG